jgi:hypothetical protein
VRPGCGVRILLFLGLRDPRLSESGVAARVAQAPQATDDSQEPLGESLVRFECGSANLASRGGTNALHESP